MFNLVKCFAFKKIALCHNICWLSLRNWHHGVYFPALHHVSKMPIQCTIIIRVSLSVNDIYSPDDPHCWPLIQYPTNTECGDDSFIILPAPNAVIIHSVSYQHWMWWPFIQYLTSTKWSDLSFSIVPAPNVVTFIWNLITTECGDDSFSILPALNVVALHSLYYQHQMWWWFIQCLTSTKRGGHSLGILPAPDVVMFHSLSYQH